ncbi:MAG: hypothetical protein IKJ74_06500 [Clostridia bacterium]|nr:hypothetical protein [Clostridia bacterium]
MPCAVCYSLRSCFLLLTARFAAVFSFIPTLVLKLVIVTSFIFDYTISAIKKQVLV